MIDSDFDEPEEVAAEDGTQAEKVARQAERKQRRGGRYVDPALKRRRVADVARTTDKKVKGGQGEDGTPSTIHRSSLRRSTKIASERAAEERERKAADGEERRRKKMLREAGKPQEKILTQKELLEEAKETEIKNRESLKELLRLEEEKKRVPVVRKKVEGEVMSMRSKGGKQTISFTNKDTDSRREMFPHLYTDDGIGKSRT